MIEKINKLINGIAKYPYDAKLYDQLGLLYIEQKNYSASIDNFKKAVKIDGQNPILHYHLANAYLANQNDEKAEQHYLIASKIAPNEAAIYNNLAKIYHNKDQKQAIKYYAKAINLKADFIIAHYNLGLLFIQQNDLESAIKCFNNVLTLNPDNINAKQQLAQIYLQQQDWLKAQELSQQILTLDQENLNALNNLGIIAIKQQQSQLAIHYFTKVIALQENHIEARENIAATFLHYDRFLQAIPHYQFILKLTPKQNELRFNLAICYMRTGELTNAINEYKLILQNDNKHLNSLTNLTVIYWRLQDYSNANQYLTEAIKLTPENEELQYMYAAINQQKYQKHAPKKYIKNLFDQYSNEYEQHMQKLDYKIPEVIQKLLNNILIKNKIYEILDIGCGTGLSSENIKPWAKKIIGIDLSAKMLAIAKTKNIYDELISGDFIDYLTKTQQKFDIIIAADVFSYYSNLTKIFKLCQQNLTADGILICSVETCIEKNFKLQKTARFAHNDDYINNIIKKVGLNLQHIEKIAGRNQEQQKIAMMIYIFKNVN